MRTPFRAPGWRGYTLLEMMLALAIGSMLLSALYFSIEMYVGAAAVGRSNNDQSNVIRSLTRLMTVDIQCSLGPVDPLIKATHDAYQKASDDAQTAAADTLTKAGAAAAAALSGDDSPVIGDGPYQFNYGLDGFSDRIVLYVAHPPREALKAVTDGADMTDPFPSDLRRITYWLASDGSNVLGLAKEEVKWATADGVLGRVPPDVDSPANFVVAEQVKGIMFKYFDGYSWVSEWHGDDVFDTDQKNKKGPPAAVRITMTLEFPVPRDRTAKMTQTVQHVVTLPTANIMNQDNATAGSQAAAQAQSAAAASLPK